MADLPSLADRLNDIEIAANAPVTETLNRRYGSNINFLLDFLGVSDGDATPNDGNLSDFVTALNLIVGHTLTLQFTNPGNGTHTIGTFASIPFVDQVIYAEDLNTTISAGAGSGFRIVPQINVDGGGFVHPGASLVTPTNFTDSAFAPGDANKIYGTDAEFGAGPNGLIPTATVAYRRSTDAVLGATGYDHRMSAARMLKFATMSWRDGASTVLRYYNENAGSAKFYLGYKLNIESIGLIAP